MMQPVASLSNRSAPPERGAALIIVLAMLVLLLGVLGAFLARSGINRDTSASSASLTAVDLLSSVAVNQVTGDLQQEIKDPARSTEYAPPNGGSTLYLPKTPAGAVPQLELPGLTIADLLPDPGTGESSGLENLLKVSENSGSTPTDQPSRNGRSITPERWNKPLFMKRTAQDGTDDSPPASFPTPDWVLVARDGSNPATLANAKWDSDPSNGSTVIGRYAYVIYNEGGLLDANIAGYPESANPAAIPGTNITNPARYKTSAAYADLTIPEIGLTPAQIDTWIKEWRNEATLSATNPAAEYFKLNLQNNSGFLSTSNQSAPGGATDRMFVGRRQLITFFEDKLDGKDSSLMDALQYFTTFSRSLNQPTFYRMQGQDNSLPNYNASAPKVNPWSTAWATTIWNDMDNLGNSAFGQDAIINPIITSITTSGTGNRIDGSSFAAGEPLIKKRFPLDRLVWVTYKGPSASLPANDPLIAALESEGISRDYLDKGTAENIEKAFGLRWTAGPGPDGLGGYWTYDVHGTTAGTNPINILEDVAGQNREPDFFELLKATIDVGSIGRARHGFNGGNLATNLAMQDQMRRDSFINNHIIQLGANIIDQVHPENYPTQIVIGDEGIGRNRSFWGTVDLPYFYGYTFGTVLVESGARTNVNPFNVTFVPELGVDDNMNKSLEPGETNYLRPGDLVPESGAVAAIQIPILWNPHARTAALPNSLSPRVFRICITSSNYQELSVSSPPATSYRIQHATSAASQIEHRPHPDMEEYYEADWGGGVSINATEGVLDFDLNNPTALLFDYDQSAHPELFRQPTPLLKNNTPAGINVRINSAFGNHSLSSINLGQIASGRDFSNGIQEVGTGDRLFGFYIGRVPAIFNGQKLTAPIDTRLTSAIKNQIPATQTYTYSLEYSPDGSASPSSWVPYKQVTLPLSSSVDYDIFDAPWEYDGSFTQTQRFWPSKASFLLRFQYGNIGEIQANGTVRRNFNNRGGFFMDPRTDRWGADTGSVVPPFIDSSDGSLDMSTGVLSSLRPGAALGLDDEAVFAAIDNTEAGASSKTSLLWNHESWHGRPWKQAGSEVNAALTPEYVPFFDADNVLRRPAGAWVPETTTQAATTTIGMPMVTGASLTTGNDRFNRPVILHRPFRSVAELSHVFSGTPWRQIDFFTPESGFTGLLDVFTISEDQRTDSLVAGKVDLNTRQVPVLKAILNGAYRDAITSRGMSDVTTAHAEELAERLVARTGSNNPGKGPLWNLAHLVGRFDPNADTSATSPSTSPLRFDGFSADLGVATGTVPENIVTHLREAPIRALTQTGQAGTWNLMVDLVVQSGKFPSTASDLNDFVVEAEKRAWLHLAIDRLTGRLLDYEIEVVTE